MTGWRSWAGCWLLALASCQKPKPPPHESLALGSSTIASAQRLPEDPVAGARSDAQWREHLAREERERKVRFDRHYLEDHERIIAQLDSLERRVARAPASELRIWVRSWSQRERDLRAQIQRVDPARDSSNLRPEYEAAVDALGRRYAEARRRALDGQRGALEQLEREWSERSQRIAHWLKEMREDDDDE